MHDSKKVTATISDGESERWAKSPPFFAFRLPARSQLPLITLDSTLTFSHLGEEIVQRRLDDFPSLFHQTLLMNCYFGLLLLFPGAHSEDVFEWERGVGGIAY